MERISELAELSPVTCITLYTISYQSKANATMRRSKKKKRKDGEALSADLSRPHGHGNRWNSLRFTFVFANRPLNLSMREVPCSGALERQRQRPRFAPYALA
jgi:hypothetical protein